MNKFFDVVTLVVMGVILANLVANASGTKTIFDGVSGLWQTSVNGMLGKQSS